MEWNKPEKNLYERMTTDMCFFVKYALHNALFLADKREQEAARIRQKYPDRIPVGHVTPYARYCADGW